MMQKHIFLVLLLTNFGCGFAHTEPAAPNPVITRPAYAQAGQCTPAKTIGVWRDQRRNRDVPYLIRMPEGCGTSAVPVVIMSHGLGGSRDGLARMSERLSSQGYIVVHPQHLGSDTGIWGGARPQLGSLDRTAIARQLANPRVTIDRMLDIPFVLSQLREANQTGPMAGRFDLSKIAMAGHSFGAVTTQAMAGQTFGNGTKLPDFGFRAFIAMSPSAARDGRNQEAFGSMRGPILFLTGSDDNFSVAPTPLNPLDRRKPFETMPETEASMLVTLVGGDHFVFDGRALSGAPKPNDARLQSVVDATSIAFLDATLKNDLNAQAWLLGTGLATFVGADARAEVKGCKDGSASIGQQRFHWTGNANSLCTARR